MINVGTLWYNFMFAKCYQLANFYYLVSKKGRFFRPDLATNWLTMKIVLFFLRLHEKYC